MKKPTLTLLLMLICIMVVSQNIVSGKTEPVKLSIQPVQTDKQIDQANKPIREKVVNELRFEIPVNPQINDKTFVVIVANENYRREVDVIYAINDGILFKEYCQKTLGIPPRNIQYLENATFGEMRGGINWISQVAEAFEGEARIIFYYAGHGMPNEDNQLPYLLPVDGFSSDFETAIKIEDLYNRFAQLPAKSVTVFLDACFSGATRDDGMLANARAVRVRPRNTALQGNLVVFSSATGSQTAFPYKEKQQGMFTYYLLKKLQESSGDVNYKELSDYLIENVRRSSIVVNQKSQTPEVNYSFKVKDEWQNFRLK